MMRPRLVLSPRALPLIALGIAGTVGLVAIELLRLVSP